MKTLPLLTLIFFTIICFGQTNYYYQNDGNTLQSEANVKVHYELLIVRHNEMSIKPVIYHREIRKDSIINYYHFSSESGDTTKLTAFAFLFRQDPMFLYLNKKLPEFKLIDINGNEFSLEQIKGKPTLINFTAIYCRPCLEEIPLLNQLKRLYKNKINFIAIFDVERNPGDVEKTIVKNPFDFHILRNTEAFKNQLNITALPYNVFIDKNGYVRYIQRGYQYADGVSDNNYFTRIIDEMLKTR